MFIQTEPTGDPARLKFLPGREVLAEGILDLHDQSEATPSPLAMRLFAVPGVAGVLLGRDFITVTKVEGEWQALKPHLLGAIMEHFLSGAPVLTRQPAPGGYSHAQSAQDGAALAAEVWNALRQVIDPELGYNIVDLGLVYDVTVDEGGAARVTMTTTTPGCPATNYLRSGAGDSAGAVRGINLVEVVLTYEPRWGPEMMSSEAKDYLGIRDGGGW